MHYAERDQSTALRIYLQSWWGCNCGRPVIGLIPHMHNLLLSHATVKTIIHQTHPAFTIYCQKKEVLMGGWYRSLSALKEGRRTRFRNKVGKQASSSAKRILSTIRSLLHPGYLALVSIVVRCRCHRRSCCCAIRRHSVHGYTRIRTTSPPAAAPTLVSYALAVCVRRQPSTAAALPDVSSMICLPH